MQDQEHYDSAIDAIRAIPKDQTKPCPIPVNVYVQEAENLHYWAQRDAQQLATVGFNLDWIAQLPLRLGALRQAQVNWKNEAKERKEAEQAWLERAPQAFKQRDKMQRYFRYAFRKKPSVLSALADIAQGSSNADMIQDLAELAGLGKKHSAELQAIKFDLAQLDQAAELASAMGELLGQANGDRSEVNAARVIRDQAYVYLKEAVDEVRDCGKLVFFEEQEFYQHYTSAYYRKGDPEDDSPSPATPSTP